MKKILQPLPIVLFALLVFWLVVWKIGVYKTTEWQKAYRVFFPPEGYFDRLAESVVQVEGAGSRYTVEFINRYPGLYVVGLHLGKRPGGMTLFDPGNLSLRVEIASKEKPYAPLLKKVISHGELNSGWQGYEDVFLVIYEVPDELPEGKILECSLIVTHGDPSFQKMYGPITLYVRKTSDE